jgi:hypothetical protein
VAGSAAGGEQLCDELMQTSGEGGDDVCLVLVDILDGMPRLPLPDPGTSPRSQPPARRSISAEHLVRPTRSGPA